MEILTVTFHDILFTAENVDPPATRQAHRATSMLAPACQRHARGATGMSAHMAMAGRSPAMAGRSPGIVCIRPPSSRGNGGQESLSMKTKDFLSANGGFSASSASSAVTYYTERMIMT